VTASRYLVHHYFGSRRDLFLGLLSELAEQLPAAIRTDLEGLALEEVVRINSTALLDAVERDRDTWVALLGAAGSDPDVEQILDRARDQAIDRMLVNQAAAVGDSEELRWCCAFTSAPPRGRSRSGRCTSARPAPRPR
jgi:AcrR family transcriptional regulator